MSEIGRQDGVMERGRVTEVTKVDGVDGGGDDSHERNLTDPMTFKGTK